MRLAAAGAAIALAAAACSSGGGGGGGGTGTASYLKWDPCCSWGTTWSLNEYSPVALGIVQGLIQLPLAVENDPSLTSFTPQLASSWTVSGDTLTIHVRPGVKWQNGKPVTSTDVYDTILLNGLGGNSQGGTTGTGGWLYISNVSAPNSQRGGAHHPAGHRHDAARGPAPAADHRAGQHLRPVRERRP